ncbi:hypothetical protein [Desulforapulum autotrophicum]|nr:hypothetical protein [Desulforapulum autotrophicum]
MFARRTTFQEVLWGAAGKQAAMTAAIELSGIVSAFYIWLRLIAQGKTGG